jgi:hypothetical protein
MGCSVISATSFFALVRASTRLAVTSAVVVRMADLLRVFQMNKIASMRMGVQSLPLSMARRKSVFMTPELNREYPELDDPKVFEQMVDLSSAT